MPQSPRSLLTIDDDHPTALLFDWLLVLLKAVRPISLCLPLQPLDMHRELAPLRPSPRLADPDAINADLPTSPICLGSILRRVVDACGIESALPNLDWRCAWQACVATNLADYEFPWRLREQLRFLVGGYTKLPWDDRLPPIPDHFAHIALDDTHLIAYTQDERKGAADIQTPIKPGRYLARFYPNLTATEVRDLQAGIAKPATLRFAISADEIEAVYTNGPASCMAHDLSHFETDVHPVRVYGDMTEMIAARVPGLYVFHRGEERGGLGSRYIASMTPGRLQGIATAIAFDRRGTGSIITHQHGGRCASDAFARSLSLALGLNHQPDPTGSFTDTANYTHLVGECTNISVGYDREHSPEETLDTGYLLTLRERILRADFSKLVCERAPGEIDPDAFDVGRPAGQNAARLYELVFSYPDAVSAFLDDLGILPADLTDYLDADPGPQT